MKSRFFFKLRLFQSRLMSGQDYETEIDILRLLIAIMMSFLNPSRSRSSRDKSRLPGLKLIVNVFHLRSIPSKLFHFKGCKIIILMDTR